ncbi:TetR/AcrR family transcriptional regulator [Amycolatopsis magusensis]|uniref:AcrR family transcriptional regulator n=1 Tax=Amycolatopsis magusensis TaxID=882444 RepID=A0ABS4PVY2_9PSEU|nr:TetR/AcrR family transcriptional regulator [Amycolatopsis magusensis]MBP2183582.1 AcrR family transcriptional regulator [Amycolatopsis magusensis]
MPRWESDAQGRLERAALELFETQGFERTTVAQIARTAGLTERSFYRYFPDKREVLFAGHELEAHLVAQVEAAAPDLTPFEALLTALGTADEVFRSREFLLRRVRVISASPALAERDLIKLADIAGALTQALERRGVDSGQARLIIDVAIAISRRATSRWLADPDATFPDLITQAAAELREAVTPRASPRSSIG